MDPEKDAQKKSGRKIEITKDKMEKIEKQAWILILSWSVIFVYF